MAAMSSETPLPWQSFFDEDIVEEARTLVERGCISRVHTTRRNLVTGRVKIRSAFSCSGELEGMQADRPGSLLATDIHGDCRCGSALMGCAHVAAVLLAYDATIGFQDPGAEAITAGRKILFDEAMSLLAAGTAGKQGPAKNRTSGDRAPEIANRPQESSAPQAVRRQEQDAKVIAFPVAPRQPPTMDHGEPPPAITVASPYRDRDGGDAWALNRWLTEHLSRSTRAVSGADHRLAYLFHRDPRKKSGWSIEVVAARVLKSGALGVHKRFRPHNLEQARDVPYATADDLAVLRWLGRLYDPESGMGGISAAAGVNGEAMVQVLATGRCFVEDLHHPLAAGPALDLIPAWVERRVDQPAWQVQARRSSGPIPTVWQLDLQQPDGSPAQLIPLDPPWYVIDGRAGPVDTPIRAHHLVALMKMPPVPADLLPAAVARLGPHVHGLPPVPASIPDATAGDIPVGHLIRWVPTVRVESGSRNRVPVELVLFAVRYAGVLCNPAAPGPVGDADGRPILRDAPREAALQAQLRHLGLVPVHEMHGHARLDWMSLPDSRTSLLPWVHQSSARADPPGKTIPLPPAILGALAAAGWTMEGGSQPPPTLDASTIEATITEPAGGDWFRLDLGVRLGDERIDLTPILAGLLADPGAMARLPQVTLDGRAWACAGLPDGRVVRLPLDLLQRLVEHLLAIFDTPPGASGWRTDPWQALSLDGLEGVFTVTGPRLADLAKRLAGLVSPEVAEPPPNLLAALRPYQKCGLAWLQRLRAAGTGGVLADDMGLGKTVQTIAHLCAEEAIGRLREPALVVGPASMVGTWRRELARFAPHLRTKVLHGGDRERSAQDLLRDRPHVVITTYATLLRDAEQAEAIAWSLVIADEAQSIANPAVKSGQVVRRLKAGQRLALTGTPMSNHLGELHSLMAWLVPGLLGSTARFDRVFRRPIEKHGDQMRAGILRQRIAPFLLRRTKELVAPELPSRTESVVTVALEGGQRALYESVRLAMDERIRAVVAAKGLARSRIEVLEALTKLRLCCCDPRLVKMAARKRPPDSASAKLGWLREKLPVLIEEGRRILLFSQFTSWLDLIEADVLTPAGLSWLRLDGSTRDRDTPVQRFQHGEVPLFLLSLKAGGTGLTLTAADTVILSDPWWNPAAEAQAADRAHRIGQDKPVFVWRLVAEGTVEERILGLQARKKALMAAMLDAQGQSVPSFTEDDLAALLAPLPE